MEVTDLLLLDIKEINPKRHQILTGQKNDNILELAKFLSEIHKQMCIRDRQRSFMHWQLS